MKPLLLGGSWPSLLPEGFLGCFSELLSASQVALQPGLQGSRSSGTSCWALSSSLTVPVAAARDGENPDMGHSPYDGEREGEELAL